MQDDPGDAHDLAPRIERLARLRSAWGVLAGACPTDRAAEIAESGRALTEHLTALDRSHSDLGPSAVAGIDERLAAFEQSIHRIAADVPVSELRAKLPAHRDRDRAGLLDLLDLLLGDEIETRGVEEARVGAIDYLVTLLCTDGANTARGIVFDPVTLTTRLHALCNAVDDPNDPRLAEVEAEFFAAANLDAEDLREELQQRTLRRRKSELGRAYFAPRVLRAIVTYNAALIARVADQILDAGDWGAIPHTPGANGPVAEPTPVFESPPLRAIAASLRKRLAGDEPEPTPVDRVAWALDLDYLADNERKALEGQRLATSDDPLGTAILIGLLSRSLAVLSIDLQEAGLDPDQIADVWVAELSEVFQEEINQNLAADAYKVACALSELKNKFLLSPLAEHVRDARASQRAAAAAPGDAAAARGDAAAAPGDAAAARGDARERADAEPAEKRESAREIVKDALQRDRDDRTGQAERPGLAAIPWARVARAALMLLIAGGGFAFFVFSGDPDLDRLSSDTLAEVSPYLERGKRNGEGTGEAFVGRISDEWIELSRAEREAAATRIVDGLRARGMRQVMIYDDEQRLRIQALGSQPTRVL